MSSPESPQRITSDSSAFEIYSPINRRRVFVNIAPDNTITTRVELIKSREEQQEQQLMATANFTGVTRHLLHSMVELEAAKMVPGSEDIPHEISVVEYQKQFFDAVRGLAGMSISERAVKRLILFEGWLFTKGQERLGEMPSVVKEKVAGLNNQVSSIYQELSKKP